MKQKKRLLMLLALACALTSGLALSSCEDSSGSSTPPPLVGTKGLQYERIENKNEYRVVGIGSATELDIIIPDTYKGLPVTEISNSAFSTSMLADNVNLTSIIIGNNVNYIGDSAFRGCSGLASVTIPDSIILMGDDVFFECTNLQYNEINGLKYLGNTQNECVYLAGVVSTDIVTAEINEHCKCIGEGVFFECENLTNISLPDAVTSISFGAFWGCGNLQYNEENELRYLGNSENKYLYLADTISTDITTANVNANCKFIGYQVFQYCRNLTSITMGNGILSIGHSAFDNCKKLESVTIASTVLSVGKRAFSNCESLKSIVIPDSVRVIDTAAFMTCRGLTSAEINANVIGDAAFSGCYALKNLTIGNNVASIEYGAFSGCTAITTIKIPLSVKHIGESAFANCRALTSITIENGVVSIGSSAFEACNSLTSIVLPKGITSIESSTFDSCDSLTSITIPAGVTSIGDQTFFNCSSLTSITFKGTTKEWESITKGKWWDISVPATAVICSDGTVSL